MRGTEFTNGDVMPKLRSKDGVIKDAWERLVEDNGGYVGCVQFASHKEITKIECVFINHVLTEIKNL